MGVKYPKVIYSGPLRDSSVIAWSPDSTRIAVGHDSDVDIVDAFTGHEILTYKGHSSMTIYPEVNAIAWSHDGRRIISASLQDDNLFDAVILMWETSSGENIIARQTSLGWVNSLNWSADGKQIAVAFKSGVIQIWSGS
jgi:WD40 repeat protein